MTRYILHGGFTFTMNKLNAGFYKEISRYLTNNANILLVYFSREENEVNKLFEQDKTRIVNQAGEKKLNIDLATREKFANQIKEADAIYMRGGGTDKLLSVLKKYPNFKQMIKDKVVAGSSAGAYVLAKYYHSASKGGIHQGLGILPIRVICHHESDRFKVDNEAVALMKDYPTNLELVVLKDFEWKTFSV